MSANSSIEWCDHTFNPWEGCQKVGPGCDHCYAERRNMRFGGGSAPNWGPDAPRRRTAKSNWRKPGAWNAQGQYFMAEHGRRQRVFCASLADVFDNAVDPQWRADLFNLIDQTPQLDWLLLTKRIGNAGAMIRDALDDAMLAVGRWPWPNVWLGATVVNQEEADRDIPKLLALPTRVRFLSIEPMLGPVDLRLESRNDIARWDGQGRDLPLRRIDWVIAGGESGPHARPAHPDWFRSLRDQCAANGVPFLFKQWGEWIADFDRERDDPDFRQCNRVAQEPGRWLNAAGGQGFHGARVHYARKVGTKAAGRLLDGVQHDGFPT